MGLPSLCLHVPSSAASPLTDPRRDPRVGRFPLPLGGGCVPWTGRYLLGDGEVGLIEGQWLYHWRVQNAVRQFHVVAPLRHARDCVVWVAIAAALRTLEWVVEGASIDMLHLEVPCQGAAYRKGLLFAEKADPLP